MTRFISFLARLGAPILAAMLFVAPAAAIDPVLEKAQAEGVIGERADGYLGFVNEGQPNAELQRRVAEVNARRREVYTRISQSSGESLSTIAALTGERQIERAESGEFVMDKTGRWRRK